MVEKTTLEEFKKSGDTYAQLAKETLEHSEKTDTVITLLGSICDVIDANLNVNKDILEEKKANHAAWIKASNRRFYISLVAVQATLAVLLVDVIKINPESEVVKGIIAMTKSVVGLFL